MRISNSKLQTMVVVALVGVFATAGMKALAEAKPEVSTDSKVKIGVVDMQRALRTVESGKKALAQLDKEFKATGKELQTEEAGIKKAADEFKKQSMVMSDEARGRKQAELQERIVKYQERAQKAQVEIQQKQGELLQPIFLKLRTIVSEVAKKQGFTLVLDKNDNNVLYHLEKDEFTDEVIADFDKAHKGTEKKISSVGAKPSAKKS